MADHHDHPGTDAGDTPMPSDASLEAPGSGDLGSGSDGGAPAHAASTGKAMAQKGVETGVKKATGSDVAVSAVRGAQKARSGDMVGGVQDVAASGAGAATTAALGATGVGAPVAGAAGSAVTSLFQTKAFRYILSAVTALVVAAVVLQTVVITGVTAAVVSAVIPPISQATALTETCTDTDTSTDVTGGPSEVVGGEVEEKVWNYLRGAGYTEEQTAGVMGNIERESGFNPFIAEGGGAIPTVGSGWGLVQWTADRHAAIRDAVISELGGRFYVAAPSMGQLPSSMGEADVDTMVLFQLRYIINELETTEQAAGDHLASTTTVEESTRSFEEKYERAGVVALAERTAHAQAFYDQYSGSPVPDSGGTTGEDGIDAGQGTAPGAGANVPGDVRDPVASSSTSGCSGSSISAGTDTGSVADCPDGTEGCVNIAALTQPSASLACPDGTRDEGTTTAYYKGNGKNIRLCSLEGATDTNGRPIIMNAMIAPAFMAFWNEATEAGLDLTLTSTYRSNAKQESLYASSPGGAARPGWSNHEFGMAFDVAGFSASYSRHNCGSTQTEEGACSYPGSGAQLERWKKIRALGLKHGMYIHDEEFWHIEFIPSGLHRDRNIDVHEG